MKRLDLSSAGCIGDNNGQAIYVLKEGEQVAIVQKGDILLRKGKIEDFEHLTKINMKFVKVNPYAFEEIGYKYPLLSILIKYTQYQTGKLVYRNGAIVTRRNLVRVCKLSQSTVDRQIRGLIEEDVIKLVRDKKEAIYFMNPYVAHSGKKVTESLLELFRNTKFKDSYEETRKGDKDDVPIYVGEGFN